MKCDSSRLDLSIHISLRDHRLVITGGGGGPDYIITDSVTLTNYIMTVSNGQVVMQSTVETGTNSCCVYDQSSNPYLVNMVNGEMVLSPTGTSGPTFPVMTDSSTGYSYLPEISNYQLILVKQ